MDKHNLPSIYAHNEALRDLNFGELLFSFSRKHSEIMYDATCALILFQFECISSVAAFVFYLSFRFFHTFLHYRNLLFLTFSYEMIREVKHKI